MNEENRFLIELEEGVLVEIQPTKSEAIEISGGFEKVKARLSNINKLIDTAIQPFTGEWLSKNDQVSELQIELGLSFTGEGNIYIVKSKGEVNFSVKITITK